MSTLAPKLVLSALAAGGLIWGLFVLRSNDPELARLPFPPCPSYALLGLHCPGCGTTRALHALLNGDMAGALRKNVALVLLLPLIGLGFAQVWLNWVASNPKWSRKLSPPATICWGILAALLLFGVLRNIPAEPFSLLAPR